MKKLKVKDRIIIAYNTFKLNRLKKQGLVVADDFRYTKLPKFGSEPYLIEIGKRVSIAFGVVFLTHDGGTCLFRDKKEYNDVIKFGKIKIEDNCFIGCQTTILPGVHIGPNSIVGASSVVTKDVPPNTVYAGNPAHFICTYEEYSKKCLMNTPQYNKDEYRKNKREVLLKILK